MKSRILTAVTVFCLSVGAGQAATIYNEAIDGDASDSLPGTSLGALSIGSSTVIGSNPGGAEDDWYQFTVAVGTQLDAIRLVNYTGPGGNLSFLQFSVFGSGPYNAGLIGTDLLESTALSAVPSFLGAGTYNFKTGTGTNQNAYELSFEVSSLTSPVPLPAAAWMLLAGLGGLTYLGRRKTA